MDTVRELAWATGIVAVSLVMTWSAGFALSLVIRAALEVLA